MLPIKKKNDFKHTLKVVIFSRAEQWYDLKVINDICKFYWLHNF